MTNILIRRLMNCGYSADTASQMCRDYMRLSSLSNLDSFISIMEAQNVDKIQSESNRKKCGRLCSPCSCKGT